MFVQHHSTASSAPSTSIVKNSEDFELSILTKSSTKITGTLQFQYLNQSFSISIAGAITVVILLCHMHGCMRRVRVIPYSMDMHV